MTSHEELLAEAVRRAASAPVDPECPSTTEHGSYAAYRHAGCRCPETRELLRVQRRTWDTRAAGEAKSFRRMVERNTVRPEVVAAILAGRRREVRARNVERNAAFWHAVRRWGRDWRVLAEKLDYSRHEVQRRLKRLAEIESELE